MTFDSDFVTLTEEELERLSGGVTSVDDFKDRENKDDGSGDAMERNPQPSSDRPAPERTG